MKITEKYLRKIIRKSLLKEDSMDAYARFVLNMQKLAIFSERSLSMQHYKKENPDLYKKVKALGQRLIKKIQDDFPGNINVEKIFDIIKLAKSEKEKNPNIDYGAKVIEIAQTVWSNNIGHGRSTEGFGATNLAAADPRARGETAKAIDRTLKYAWREEKNQPENKEFWNNFEVWHAIGGIVKGGEGYNHDEIFTFLDTFKDNNPHELSGYGWDGRTTPSDDKRINPGIKSIINNSSQARWPDKFHIKLKGDITFAAGFDITTQWLSYKEEDDKNFEKSGDFNKMLNWGKYGGLITGPSDKLLGGQDTYNEIVIRDSQIDGISMPGEYITWLKEMTGKKSLLGYSDTGYVSLRDIYVSLKRGDEKRAADLLIKIGSVQSNLNGGIYPQQAFNQIKNYLLTGDISYIDDKNVFINNKKRLEQYLSYDVPIYENQSGKNITNLLKEFIDVIDTCMQPNPYLVERRNVTVKEAILRSSSYKNQNHMIELIEKFPSTLMKNKKFTKFIFSDEGKKLIEEYAALQRQNGNMIYYFNFDNGYTEETISILSDPNKFLNQKVAESSISELLLGSIPQLISDCVYTIAHFVLDYYNNYKEIPGYGFLRKKPLPPPPKKVLSYNFTMNPPYYFHGKWTEPSGQKKEFTDRSTTKHPHQTDRKYFIDMVSNIVKYGGFWEKFMLWNIEKGKWENVNLSNLSHQEIKTVLNSILAPPLPGSEYDPFPEPRGKVSEIKISRKQISNLIKKVIL